MCFPRWLLEDLPTHLLFLQCDIEKWGPSSLPLDLGRRVTLVEMTLCDFGDSGIRDSTASYWFSWDAPSQNPATHAVRKPKQLVDSPPTPPHGKEPGFWPIALAGLQAKIASINLPMVRISHFGNVFSYPANWSQVIPANATWSWDELSPVSHPQIADLRGN